MKNFSKMWTLRTRCVTQTSSDQTIQTKIRSDKPIQKKMCTIPTSVVHWGCQTDLSCALGCQTHFSRALGVPNPLQSRIGGTLTDTFNCLNSSNHWYNTFFRNIYVILWIWFSSFFAKNISLKQKMSSTQQQLLKLGVVLIFIKLSWEVFQRTVPRGLTTSFSSGGWLSLLLELLVLIRLSRLLKDF